MQLLDTYCFQSNRMTEQFNLSWKEHGLNTAKTLHNLRDDDQLCDVTIACEEGVFLGHKIVLYASSLLFRSILKKHTHPHPLIYLKNISGRENKENLVLKMPKIVLHCAL